MSRCATASLLSLAFSLSICFVTSICFWMASSFASRSAISALIQCLRLNSAWHTHLARQSAKLYLGTEYAIYEMFPLVDLFHSEYSTAALGAKLIHTRETSLTEESQYVVGLAAIPQLQVQLVGGLKRKKAKGGDASS